MDSLGSQHRAWLFSGILKTSEANEGSHHSLKRPRWRKTTSPERATQPTRGEAGAWETRSQTAHHFFHKILVCYSIKGRWWFDMPICSMSWVEACLGCPSSSEQCLKMLLDPWVLSSLLGRGRPRGLLCSCQTAWPGASFFQGLTDMCGGVHGEEKGEERWRKGVFGGSGMIFRKKLEILVKPKELPYLGLLGPNFQSW